MERTLALEPGQELATLAGGCFWGMEDILRKIDGIVETEVGYTGGVTKNPVYETVKVGNTGHAESIQIVFKPDVISFAEVLKWFFKMHDPTTVNQQGNDKGSQYRSVIFYHSDAQRETALQAKKEAELQWKKPVVTEVIPAKPFYSAEKYHQDYLEKNPGGYTCHYVRRF
ncbi:MAG: peptide-methionine (S)-S-oxide reductase MsrA [Bdellovibrionota bacterium]